LYCGFDSVAFILVTGVGPINIAMQAELIFAVAVVVLLKDPTVKSQLVNQTKLKRVGAPRRKLFSYLVKKVNGKDWNDP